MIQIDPNFICPACDQPDKNVVLLCTRCWHLLPPVERAGLRRMTVNRQDTKSKLAKCVRIVKEKLCAG